MSMRSLLWRPRPLYPAKLDTRHPLARKYDDGAKQLFHALTFLEGAGTPLDWGGGGIEQFDQNFAIPVDHNTLASAPAWVHTKTGIGWKTDGTDDILFIPNKEYRLSGPGSREGLFSVTLVVDVHQTTEDTLCGGKNDTSSANRVTCQVIANAGGNQGWLQFNFSNNGVTFLINQVQSNTGIADGETHILTVTCDTAANSVRWVMDGIDLGTGTNTTADSPDASNNQNTSFGVGGLSTDGTGSDFINATYYLLLLHNYRIPLSVIKRFHRDPWAIFLPETSRKFWLVHDLSAPVAKNVTDAPTVSILESMGVDVTVTPSDTPTVSLAETMSVAVTLEIADTLGVLVTDSLAIEKEAVDGDDGAPAPSVFDIAHRAFTWNQPWRIAQERITVLDSIDERLDSLEAGGGGGGVAGVSSFNGRTGAVVPQVGDYTAGQLTGVSSFSTTVLDDTSASAWRVTLELGDAATKDVGTGSGDVAAGNRGIAAGGADGQVLTKQSGADFDVAWETPSGGGGGGSVTPSIVKIEGTTHTLAKSQGTHTGAKLVVDNADQSCTITVPDAVAESAEGVEWDIQAKTTGLVKIKRETNGTLNGVTEINMATGPNAFVSVLIESNGGSAPVARVEGDTTETRFLAGKLDAQKQIIEDFASRKYNNLAGNQTLEEANFDPGSTLVHSGSSATYTLPSRLSPSENTRTHWLRIHNRGSSTITLDASGVNLRGNSSIASGNSALLEWDHDGVTEHVWARVL